MPDPLAAILARSDDSALCEGLYQLLRAHHGPAFVPDAIPAEHRTVLLVWHSQEVIANRGFNGFFGADRPGDADYAHMRAAYDMVGCESASSAVRRVFDAFPDCTPPTDPRERVRAFGKANHALHGAMNRDFLKVHPALLVALAAYIREHVDAFAGIEWPASDPLTADIDPAGDSEESTEIQVSNLPYWARIAFFARCARHVLPLWDEAWPAAPPEYRAVIEQTIVLAERSAAEGRPAGEVRMAATHPARVASAAMAVEEGRDSPDRPPEHPQRAGLIAATAGSALDYVSGEDLTGSLEFARALTDLAELDALLDDIHEDFRRLEELSHEGGWTDRTPVPPNVFNPSYKPGKSRWKVW